MTSTPEQQGQASRPGRRQGMRARALVAVSLLSLLGSIAVTGTAAAAAPTSPRSAAAPHAVLPAGAVEAGTGMQPDINQVSCYVGDDFWDMKINGTWYCWANNGSVDVYPKYYDVSRIYTHNNSGTIWYYSPTGGVISDNLADWTNYVFDGYDLQLTGFTITGR